MCGGPPKLTESDCVRLYGNEVLGTIYAIDRTHRQRYVYHVEWDGGAQTTGSYSRSELIKTSRRAWEKRPHDRQIELEKQMLERRKQRKEKQDVRN